VVTRNDNDFAAKVNAKGNPKASVDAQGNLNAANPDGTGTTYQHVLGSNPANTPYISTTDNTLTAAPKNYGGNQITIDTQQLQRDLNAGKVSPTTEIVTPQKLQADLSAKVSEVQAKFDANPSRRNKEALDDANKALEFATRDGECLIKGCVPAPYIQWPNGAPPIVLPNQTVPSVPPAQ
jgi:filamentous hemagglutinin